MLDTLLRDTRYSIFDIQYSILNSQFSNTLYSILFTLYSILFLYSYFSLSASLISTANECFFGPRSIEAKELWGSPPSERPE